MARQITNPEELDAVEALEKELDRAARAFGKAETQRDEAILRASLAGSSLRQIALITGLSHETIRGIVKRKTAWLEREREFLGGPPAAGATFASQARAEKHRERRRTHLRTFDIRPES